MLYFYTCIKMKTLPLVTLSIALSALLGFSSFLQGQDIMYTFQDGISPADGEAVYDSTADTHITGESGLNLNYGAVSSQVGLSSFNLARGLIRFDGLENYISSSDASYISSVNLTLRIGSPGAQTKNANAEIYVISSDNAGWIQGSGSGTLEVGAPAWKSLATGTGGNDAAGNRVQWTGGEGLGSAGGGGYSAAPVGTFTAIDGVDTFYTIALPVALVQSWITDPSSNAGLLVRVSNESDEGQFFTYSSSEAATQSYRPELEVNLSIPEASSALPLGVITLLVVCATVRRRHRVSTQA